jgi:hypothetical protein
MNYKPYPKSKASRIVEHSDHYDIENLVLDSDGNEVWAVVMCSQSIGEKTMKQYRIIYTRPYLPAPERHETQRAIVNAMNEDDLRDIYRDCEIKFIEELHPVVASQEIERLSDPWRDERLDNGLTDDQPYRPASAEGEYPF